MLVVINGGSRNNRHSRNNMARKVVVINGDSSNNKVRPKVNNNMVKMVEVRLEPITTKALSSNNRISTVRDKTRSRSGAREKTIRVRLNSTIKKIAEMQT